MALIVETGEGLTDSQTYRTAAQFKLFAAARGQTVPTSAADCEVLLMKAMDAMRGLVYVGDRATRDQALDWPRTDVEIDGFAYASTELPPMLGDAQCALAIEAQTADLLPTVATGGAVVEETVGPVTTRYAEGFSRSAPLVQRARVFLAPLLRHQGGILQVSRA